MDLLNNYVAHCLNCEWAGSVAEAPIHENDEHMVVFNPTMGTYPEVEMEILDDPEENPEEFIDYGCGC